MAMEKNNLYLSTKTTRPKGYKTSLKGIIVRNIVSFVRTENEPHTTEKPTKCYSESEGGCHKEIDKELVSTELAY